MKRSGVKLLLFSLMVVFFGLSSSRGIANDCSQEFALECPKGQIDACLLPNAHADHHFCTVQNPKRYEFLGKLTVAEVQDSFGYLYLTNGTPAITEFVLVMDSKCRFNNGSVIKANPNQVIEPTKFIGKKLLNKQRDSYYYFLVNGGYGAVLSSIVVGMNQGSNPLVTKYCPVTIYATFSKN